METLVAGRYRLVEQIGRGGMGTVWRAEDTLLGREVAVKRLTARLEASDQEQHRRYERMRREARSAALIAHRNVVVVHDIVEDAEGLPCIVMELVRGYSLAQAIEGGPLAPSEVARIGGEVLAALRAAHDAGVLHRDVKPGNVLLAEDGRVVLTDFGIAVWAGASPLTQTGEMTGSAGYIAPERLYAAGGDPGPASDLWALGATLYRAVEGRGPFYRPTALETAYATVAEEPFPVRRAGSLAPVIEGLLARDPADRLSADQAERLLTETAAASGRTASAFAPLPFPAGTPPQGDPLLPTAPGAEVPYPPGHPTASFGEPGTTPPEPDPGPRTDRLQAGPVPLAALFGESGAAPPAGPLSDAHADFAATPPHHPEAPAFQDSPSTQAGHQLPPTPPPSRPVPSRRGRGPRSQRRTAVSVGVAAVALAALAWAATSLGDHRTPPRAATGPSATAAPTSSGNSCATSPAGPAATSLPHGYRWAHYLGAVFAVPAGWQAKERTDGQQVDFVDPANRVVLRIGRTDLPGNNPVAGWQSLEQKLSKQLTGYQRLRLQSLCYQGGPAAVWEFTWEASVPYRAIDLGWSDAQQNGYGIYLSAPAAQWQTDDPVFDTAVRTFRAG